MSRTKKDQKQTRSIFEQTILEALKKTYLPHDTYEYRSNVLARFVLDPDSNKRVVIPRVQIGKTWSTFTQRYKRDQNIVSSYRTLKSTEIRPEHFLCQVYWRSENDFDAALVPLKAFVASLDPNICEIKTVMNQNGSRSYFFTQPWSFCSQTKTFDQTSLGCQEENEWGSIFDHLGE